MFNIFEQCWTMVIAGILSVPITLFIRRIYDRRKRLWLMAIPFVLAGGGIGLDYFVKTDTEMIKETITAAAKAVEQERPSALEPLICRRYRDSYHHSKHHLMQHCKSVLSNELIKKNVTRFISVELAGDKKADVSFTVRVVFDERSRMYQNFKRIMFTKIAAGLEKTETNKWLICSAELVSLDRRTARWTDIVKLRW